MIRISSERFKPKRGTMNAHIVDNVSTGLKPELTYNIGIPLEPFDLGLDDEPQPVETSFRLESMNLPVSDWRNLDGKSFELGQDDSDGSIYLGSVHNPVSTNRIKFTRLESLLFRIECTLFCDFEFEGAAENMTVELSADVDFTGMVVQLEQRAPTKEDVMEAQRA